MKVDAEVVQNLSRNRDLNVGKYTSPMDPMG